MHAWVRLALVTLVICGTGCRGGSSSRLRPAPCGNDSYEPNDSTSQAYDLLAQQGVWLGALAGLGVAADDDYYAIYPGFGADLIQVDVTFTHADGDIDVCLLDPAGDVLDCSTSTTDDESVSAVYFCPGPLYVRVFSKGAPGCNTYDLMWNIPLVVDCFPDPYEPNGGRATAYDLSADEQIWISSILGMPIAQGSDYFQIFVDPGQNRVLVDVPFTHAWGDIDLELQDAAGNVVAGSTSATDDENIDVVVPPGGGTYFVHVYPVGCPECNGYDLWWDDVPP